MGKTGFFSQRFCLSSLADTGRTEHDDEGCHLGS